MTDNVTRLPCQTYLNDTPESLREMARQIESGEMASPELLVMVSAGANGIEVFTQGKKADDNLAAIGLLSLGKDLLHDTHRNDIEASRGRP